MQRYPFSTLFKQHPRKLLAGFCIGGMATAPFTTVITFINPVLMALKIIDEHTLMMLQTLLILIAIITLIFSGYIADKLTPQKVMRFGALALVCISPFALEGLNHMNFLWIIIGEAALLITNELLLGPSNAYLKNSFDGPYRYRAASFSFTLGMSIVGGVTPLIENSLYKQTGHFSAIAIWLMIIGLATFITTSPRFLHKKISPSCKHPT